MKIAASLALIIFLNIPSMTLGMGYYTYNPTVVYTPSFTSYSIPPYPVYYSYPVASSYPDTYYYNYSKPIYPSWYYYEPFIPAIPSTFAEVAITIGILALAGIMIETLTH